MTSYAIDTIGPGGGYPDVDSWIAATMDPIGNDTVYEGRILHTGGPAGFEKTFTNITWQFDSANTDSTRYRVLTAEPGKEFLRSVRTHYK